MTPSQILDFIKSKNLSPSFKDSKFIFDNLLELVADHDKHDVYYKRIIEKLPLLNNYIKAFEKGETPRSTLYTKFETNVSLALKGIVNNDLENIISNEVESCIDKKDKLKVEILKILNGEWTEKLNEKQLREVNRLYKKYMLPKEPKDFNEIYKAFINDDNLEPLFRKIHLKIFFDILI